MEGSRRSPQSDDPFAGFSILSLLPRTIGTAPVDPLPSSQAHEVESIRCFLKSAAVESSSKDVLEQAKEINKSHQCGARVPERDEDMALAQGKDRQQGRRPALGRKRAQFSLKPVAPVNAIPHVDVSSQIEHIEDPEEYFLAFEQLENADRELKKLRGDISTNPVQNDPKGTRKRRPGLLGKTASYKHHFSATDAAPEACKSLQDLAPDGGSSSVRVSNDILCCNTADQPITSQPMNTIDLPFDSKKRGDNKEDVANALLDNLLCSFKELGEGEEEAMLRKSLHIKSIDVGKIHLPELHTVQPIGPKASNTSQMQNGLSMCQLPQTSTSQARSPFAAISALYKRISLKGQLKTPYPVSPFNMDSDPSARKAKRIVSPMVVSNGHNEISSPVSKFSIPHTGNQTIIDDNSETVEELTIGCHYSDKSITDQSQKIVDNGTNISDQLEEEGNDIHSNCPEAERLTSSCIDINMTKNVMSTGLEGSADHSSWRSDVNASLCNDTHLNDVMPNDSSPEVQHPTSACAEINVTDSCSGVEYRTSSRCEIKMTKKLTSTDHECTADHSSRKSDVNGGLCNDMYLDNVTSNDSFPEVEHSTSACHEINMIESLTSTDHECTAGRSSLRSDDDTRLSHAHNILQDEVTVIAEDEQLTDVNCSTGQLTSYPTSSVYPCPPTSLSPSTDGPAADTSTLSGENNEVHGPQGSQDEAGKQKSFSTRQNKEKLKSIRQSLAGADSQNEAGKLKLLRTRQSKEKLKSKRQSLAGAGLAWQSGVRRSTRIRSRPLEFWRGERFLYGRIHDSLATVIGVKYASPGKEERSKDQALKVKSFVSDEYEDLVSQAAAC